MHKEKIKENNIAKFPVSIDCNIKIYEENLMPLMYINKHMRLLYFVYSDAVVKFDSREIDIKAGEILVLPPDLLYSIRAKNEQAMYHSITIERNFCECLDFKLNEFNILKLIDNAEVKNHFEQMVLDYKIGKELYKIKILSEALSVLNHLYKLSADNYKNSLTASENNKLSAIKNAILHIEQNFNKSISVDDLSDITKTDKSYFSRVFKEITGIPPIEYINRYRCKKAECMLKTNNKAVSEIARLCGFDNLSYFTRTYKKYIGSLPSKTMQR
ncbi:MAG: helix-turn-helix transcriptional regulator [Clostridia bacterium]|nr:helix-turn-helix transcriptional regulator [Clostridia bacterium]